MVKGWGGKEEKARSAIGFFGEMDFIPFFLTSVFNYTRYFLSDEGL